jgi:hypothetical protein
MSIILFVTGVTFCLTLVVATMWRTGSRRSIAIGLVVCAAPLLFFLLAVSTIHTPMDGYGAEIELSKERTIIRDLSMSLGRGSYLAILRYPYGSDVEVDLQYELSRGATKVSERESGVPLVLPKGTNNHLLGHFRVKEYRSNVRLIINVATIDPNIELPLSISIARVW